MEDETLPDRRPTMSGKSRSKRTRAALVEAFNHLVLNRRKRNIRVADIIEQAKLGRSTFYDHYPNAYAVHLEALRRPFEALADAAAGEGDEVALTHILSHFWDYRQLARTSLGEPTRRLLAEMVKDRLSGADYRIAPPIAARQLAASVHSALEAWLAGEASCTAAALADAISRSGRAQAGALRRSPEADNVT
jgi:AcrR family transcriptional regulator